MGEHASIITAEILLEPSINAGCLQFAAHDLDSTPMIDEIDRGLVQLAIELFGLETASAGGSDSRSTHN